MRAKMFKDSDGFTKILCADGSIAKADENNILLFLRQFQNIEELKGNDGIWNTDGNSMEMYKNSNPIYAYITDEHQLIINNSKPFLSVFKNVVNNLQDLISVEEYARSVGKSVEQVKIHLRNGRIPNARKIGRDWVISRDSINHYPSDGRKRRCKTV